MPFYDYICEDCIDCACKELGVDDLNEDQESALIFETRYGFDADEDEICRTTECPFCESHKTKKIVCTSSAPYIRIRGHNWEEFRRKNQKAISRDMAVHQLESEDPYASMRQPGEADQLKHDLQTGGNRDKNTDKKTFVMRKSNSDK